MGLMFITASLDFVCLSCLGPKLTQQWFITIATFTCYDITTLGFVSDETSSCQLLFADYRRLLKNDCSISAQRPASTPPRTSILWFNWGWLSTCTTERTAPALGSSAP